MAEPKTKSRTPATEADKARAAQLAAQVETARAKAMETTASAFRAIGDEMLKTASALSANRKPAVARKSAPARAGGRVKIVPTALRQLRPNPS